MPYLKIRRQALAAGVVTAVYAPTAAHKVKIGNASADDLRLYDQNVDLSQYLNIGAGFDREIVSADGRHIFDPNLVAFYVNALAGGVVVLEWV